MKINIFLLAFMLLNAPVWAYSEKEIIDAIIHVESGGNPKAISSQNNVGLMQVGVGAVKDYNKHFGTKYYMRDMKNPVFNRQVGEWYFNFRCKELLLGYKIPVTLENKLIVFNAGIIRAKNYHRGQVGLPRETRNYIKKINQYLRRKK